MFSENRPHYVEKKDFNRDINRTTEQRVIERAKAFIAERKIDILGRGQSGEILRFIDDTVGARWVMKRETGYHGKQQELGLTFEDEFKIHEQIYETIERAKYENKRKKYAHIPRPYAYIKDDDGNAWIAMEMLKGETLFERAAKNLLYTISDDPEERAEIERMRKSQLLDELLKNFGTVFEDEHFSRIAREARQYSKGECKFLTKEQFTAVANTLEELHRNGIYHRDFHASNVMLLENGSAAVLDFGTSVKVNPASPEAATVFTAKVIQIDERTTRSVKIIPDTAQLRIFENFVTRK